MPVRDDEKPKMATNIVAAGSQDDGPDDRDREPSPRAVAAAGDQHSFFTIYKKGQGYWTRMLTAGGALLLLLITAQFVYGQVLATMADKNLRLGIAVAIAALGGVLAWWIMNRRVSVDFLVATDSEMKKVNWTSREALMGSTKVVILFMFLISFFLFGIDLIFGYFFYFINVLHSKPL